MPYLVVTGITLAYYPAQGPLAERVAGKVTAGLVVFLYGWVPYAVIRLIIRRYRPA